MAAITEWLITHDDDPIETDTAPVQNIEPPTASCTSSEDPENVNNASVSPVAKSIQCDDCGKLFKTQEEVEFHASKSGNTQTLISHYRKKITLQTLTTNTKTL